MQPRVPMSPNAGTMQQKIPHSGERAVEARSILQSTVASNSVLRSSVRHFYLWMAGVFVLIAFGGFTPTYWARVASGTFHGPPILHIHGALLFSWTLFYLMQTAWIASGHTPTHRARNADALRPAGGARTAAGVRCGATGLDRRSADRRSHDLRLANTGTAASRVRLWRSDSPGRPVADRTRFSDSNLDEHRQIP